MAFPDLTIGNNGNKVTNRDRLVPLLPWLPRGSGNAPNPAAGHRRRRQTRASAIQNMTRHRRTLAGASRLQAHEMGHRHETPSTINAPKKGFPGRFRLAQRRRAGRGGIGRFSSPLIGNRRPNCVHTATCFRTKSSGFRP